jgi:hypothetical protein
MATASFKVEFPRRQAMLTVIERKYIGPAYAYDKDAYIERKTGRVPVFVWPMPTQDGYFIVEHQDGRCHKVQPDSLTFLGSKELFDQCDWEEA